MVKLDTSGCGPRAGAAKPAAARDAGRKGAIGRQEGRAGLAIAIEIDTRRLAMQFVTPFAQRHRAGAIGGAQHIGHRQPGTAQMRHIAMLLGQRRRRPQALVMPLQEQRAAIRLDQRCRRKGARRMPGQRRQPASVGKMGQHRRRLVHRDRRPGRRLQRQPHAMDQMRGGGAHRQKARDSVATTARPLPT